MTTEIVVLVPCLIAVLLLAIPLARGTFSHKRNKQGKAAQSERLEILRRNLLVKTLGDEYTVDSLIGYERERLGNLPLDELMEAAIERWEHDNR